MEDKRDSIAQPVPADIQPDTASAEPVTPAPAADEPVDITPAPRPAVKKAPATAPVKAAGAPKPKKGAAGAPTAKPAKAKASGKGAKAQKATVAPKPKKAKAPVKLTPEEKKRRAKRRRTLKLVGKIVGRFFLFVFVVLLAVVVGLYAVLNEVFRGPSQTAGDKLTLTLLETSAGKFVPRLYYSEEEIEAIKERNKIVELTEQTDTNLVTITPPDETGYTSGEDGPQVVDGMILEEIKGATYHGWMLTVLDPSRVSLAVSAEWFDENRPGMRIGELAEKYGAVAAINGGSFNDSGGMGNGGMPNGVTVSQGTVLNVYASDNLVTAGFNNDNVLIVGKMTRDWARENGIRDACSFGPALVVNGVGAEVTGGSSGLNPRTAIGQRADGAVLMLVIDGRQVNSLGASLADLVEIMLNYGAVNACNLDGGSSSNLYYKGELVNDGVAITGARRIPTAFIVR